MGRPLVGIFVGGEGRRMGGLAKGLLETQSGESVVERLVRIAREALGDVDVVLVGRAEKYAALGLESLADEPAGIGPVGGLGALLSEGSRRGAPYVLALACDMPFVSPELLAELARTEGAAVAPVRDEKWEPLCARYEPSRAREALERVLASGRRSLWAVLDELGAEALELRVAPAELEDWDEPGDLER